MTVEECRRNAFGVSVIFLHNQHKIAVEAKSKMRYRPMAETDADVLAALSSTNAEHAELYDDNEDINASDDVGVTSTTDKPLNPTVESIIFNHEIGSGISGTISAPPQKWFTLAGANNNVVAPPTPHPAAFHDLIGNQVICLTYASPVEDPGSHKSEQLPGVIADKCILTSFDLMPRKPPRLNKGGFNIVELALKVKKNFNPNNIISYNNNGYGNGNDTGHGYNNNNNNNNYNNNSSNNQRQFNQGSNPQQFLQHFQQQQQQYRNNNSNNNNNNNNNGHQQGYGNDMAQRSYGNRDNDRDRDNRFNGGDGRDRQQGGNDRYNDNNRQYNNNQNRNNQPYSDNSRSYGQQGQGPGPPGYMPPHQQYPPRGYQQQQQQPQYNGHYQTAQGYPQQQPHNNGSARHSFSTQPPMPTGNGNGNGFGATSMDSMRAQLAQTLQQQQQQGGNNGPPPGPGPFSSLGNRKDLNQGSRRA